MRLRWTVVCAAAVLALAGSARAGGSGTGVRDCGDGPGGHQLTWTPTSVWPPNHKYVDITVTYSDQSADHDLTLAATGATHDELVGGSELPGAGNTGGDVVLPAGAATGRGSVSVVVRVRGERSGQGDGRVYTIDVTATSHDAHGDQDNDCSGTVTVGVPHDCRAGACRGIPRP